MGHVERKKLSASCAPRGNRSRLAARKDPRWRGVGGDGRLISAMPVCGACRFKSRLRSGAAFGPVNQVHEQARQPPRELEHGRVRYRQHVEALEVAEVRGVQVVVLARAANGQPEARVHFQRGEEPVGKDVVRLLGRPLAVGGTLSRRARASLRGRSAGCDAGRRQRRTSRRGRPRAAGPRRRPSRRRGWREFSSGPRVD